MQVERKVTELSPEDRAVLERLLGRALEHSEVVQLTAVHAEVARKIAAHKALLQSIRETQAVFAHIPEDELEELIDETCEYVRHHPE
jgi:hypothetical protein